MGQHAQVLVERRGERGVSELIGTVLLVGLVITAMAIVTVIVLSSPPPEQVPHVNALAGNTTGSVLVYHNGGDELKEEMTSILLNDNPAPVDHSKIFLKQEDGSIESRPWSETKTPWSVGKTLVIETPTTPEDITVIYRGPSSQNIILRTSFIPSTSNTPTPTATLTPTSTPTSTPTPTATLTPTPTPTPSCGTISGTKYNDLNGNGKRDAGEPGIAGWTIQCYNKQNGNWVLMQTTTTNVSGYYIFSGLQYSQHADDYQVRETILTGWIATNPQNGISSSYTLNQPHCYENGVDFGNQKVPPPSANFIASPTTGYAPLSVQFTDTSTGKPAQWQWDVNNDGNVDYTVQNPAHTYTAPGTYTVKLTVSNAGGSNTLIRTGYITVSSPPTSNVYLVASKAGNLQDGGYIVFRVTGPYSYIKHGNSHYNLNIGDTVRLEITSDGSGTMYMTSSTINDFRFTNVGLTLNGVDMGTKDIGGGDIWISGYDSYQSTLTLLVPSGNAWTQLVVNGASLIYGTDSREIRIFNLRPDSWGTMNLNTRKDVFYSGGATGYQLA